jgi:thiamine biosynthesis lipoprotein
MPTRHPGPPTRLPALLPLLTATALFVAGPEQWQAVARRMGIKYVMLVDARGKIHMNPAMVDKIRLDSPDAALQLSEPL